MMWGLHGTTDAEMGLSLSNKHTLKERMGAPSKYNLIVEAMNAGMQTSTVIPTPTPTTTPTPTRTPTPTPATPTQTPAPTPTSSASQLGLRVVMFSILSLANCVLSIF